MKWVIPVCIVLMISFLASASAASTDPAWQTYQHTTDSEASAAAAFSVWSSASGADLIISNGDTTQALTGDVDNDGTQELFVTGSNYVDLFHYQLTVNGVSQSVESETLAERNLMNVNQVQPSLLRLSDGQLAWITIANNSIEAFAYDRQNPGLHAFTRVYPKEFLENCTVWNGIRCNDATETCYALCQKQSLGSLGVYSFDFTANTTVRTNITNMTLRNVSAGHISQPFALADINGDASDEISFACNTNGNTAWGVCVYDTGSHLLSPYFSGDGIMDDLSRSSSLLTLGSQFITEPMVVNLNNNGDKEIVVGVTVSVTSSVGACTEGVINSPTVIALKASSSDPLSPSAVYWNTTFVNALNKFGGCTGTTQGIQYMSQPFLMKQNGTNYVCVSQNHVQNSNTRSDGCLLATTGATVYTLNATQTPLPVYATSGFSFLTNATTDSDDFVMGSFLYHINQSNIIVNAGSIDSFTSSYSSIASDVLNDGNVELIGSTDGTTDIHYVHTDIVSGSANPPTLFQNMTNSGYTGYFTGSTCVGTTLVFHAVQCPQIGCNYNDNSGSSERISTNCGTGGIINGNFSTDSPEVSCTYNTTGTFLVTLYLQNQEGTSDLTQFNQNPIVVNVLDGIPGQTCNLASSIVAIPSSNVQTQQQNEIDQSVHDTFSLLFGTSVAVRVLVSLAIILAVCYGVSQDLKNGHMTLLAGMLTLGAETAIGFLPGYIAVVFFMSILFTGIISKFVMSARESG